MTGGKSGSRGKRSITSDEAELWQRVAGSLDKLKNKPRVGTAAAEQAPAPDASGRRTRSPAKARSAELQPSRSMQSTNRPSVSEPPADIDRRQVRRITSGRIAIEARLDLHGLRQDRAKARLRSFLFDAHSRGLRTVLVITGKGGERKPADELAEVMGAREHGVLRRSVRLWLEQPELRAIVLSFAGAGPRHGGEGALYVQLRKATR